MTKPDATPPIHAARKAPTIPPAKRSGTKTVKCQIAMPTIDQTKTLMPVWSRRRRGRRRLADVHEPCQERGDGRGTPVWGPDCIRSQYGPEIVSRMGSRVHGNAPRGEPSCDLDVTPLLDEQPTDLHRLVAPERSGTEAMCRPTLRCSLRASDGPRWLSVWSAACAACATDPRSSWCHR